MSIARGVPQILEGDKDPEFKFPSVPFAFLPSQVNGGIDQSLNGDKLAHLLSIAYRSLPELSSYFNARRYVLIHPFPYPISNSHTNFQNIVTSVRLSSNVDSA